MSAIKDSAPQYKIIFNTQCTKNHTLLFDTASFQIKKSQLDKNNAIKHKVHKSVKWKQKNRKSNLFAS